MNIKDNFSMVKDKEMDHGKDQMDNLLKENIREISEMAMAFICGPTAIHMKENSSLT